MAEFESIKPPPKKKNKKTGQKIWDAQSFARFEAAQQGLGSHYGVGKQRGADQIEIRTV